MKREEGNKVLIVGIILILMMIKFNHYIKCEKLFLCYFLKKYKSQFGTPKISL